MDKSSTSTSSDLAMAALTESSSDQSTDSFFTARFFFVVILLLTLKVFFRDFCHDSFDVDVHRIAALIYPLDICPVHAYPEPSEDGCICSPIQIDIKLFLQCPRE